MGKTMGTTTLASKLFKAAMTVRTMPSGVSFDLTIMARMRHQTGSLSKMNPWKTTIGKGTMYPGKELRVPAKRERDITEPPMIPVIQRTRHLPLRKNPNLTLTKDIVRLSAVNL